MATYNGKQLIGTNFMMVTRKYCFRSKLPKSLMIKVLSSRSLKRTRTLVPNSASKIHKLTDNIPVDVDPLGPDWRSETLIYRMQISSDYNRIG